MARLDRSYVRYRFVFGSGNVKGRQRYQNTAAGIARNVAFDYAQNQYTETRKIVEETVRGDVEQELVNIASQYRRFIIGANGAMTRPAGVLKSLITGVPTLALSGALPSWAPRNAEYLRRKRNATGNEDWFDNRGWRRRGGQSWAPDSPGLLFQKSRAEVWEDMFGPIKVRFFKSRALQQPTPSATLSTGASGHTEIAIGTIQIYALSKITPQMLPALAQNSGAIPMASDEGNDGLMDLVKAKSEPLAYRMGQRSSLTKRYRPTLEPFLSFFLTRSIPAALQRRLAAGRLGRLIRQS